MALPTVITRGARRYYKDAKGRFISRAKYELLRRKDPVTGRFLSKAALNKRRVPNTQEAENYLRQQLGRPPSGLNWVQIASKYGERFEDFIEGIPR